MSCLWNGDLGIGCLIVFYLQLLFFLFAFPGYKATPEGAATVYHPRDGSCGTHRADGKPFLVTDRHFAHRSLPLGTKGVICNTVSGKCAKSYVGDRGPYGALLMVKDGPKPGPGWKVKSVQRKCFWHKDGASLPCEQYAPKSKGVTKPRIIRWNRKYQWYQVQIRLAGPKWKRRGDFDLTRPVGREISHRPFQRVLFFYIPRVKKLKKLRKSRHSS